MKLGLIVEGHGEVAAAPLLVRRVLAEFAGVPNVEIPTPIRIPRSSMVKDEALSRAVDLIARKTAPNGSILVLLDADDDCPARLGPRLLATARKSRPDRRVAVVLANREYETWLMMGAESLRGRRGLPIDLSPPPNPDDVRDAKGWFSRQMAGKYSETIDQAALTAKFDLHRARRHDSFDKLVRDLTTLVNSENPRPEI